MADQPKGPAVESAASANDAPVVLDLDVVGDLLRMLRGRKIYLITATAALLAITAWGFGKLSSVPTGFILFEALLFSVLRFFLARLDKACVVDLKSLPRGNSSEDPLT